MNMSINVHMLPSLTSPNKLDEHTVVVIDVLRASTTIIHALAAGASEVVPCLDIDQAREIANRHQAKSLLGGERGGLKIEGFDLGNSPSEYTAEFVGNRTVVMTTTNGTRAISLCSHAKKVVIGAFVNLSSVVATIENSSEVDLLCAGTDGSVTREDVLLAGAVIDRILSRDHRLQLNDQGLLAHDAWLHAISSTQSLKEVLLQTQGGRNLVRIGQESDIVVAARIDGRPVVPVLDQKSGSLRLL